MANEESLGSLPTGWIREPKQRPNGKTDMYYINLETGVKCRSKIEVARYTKSGNLCNHMPQQIKRCSRENKKPRLQMEDLPEWLPAGWSMEIKSIKSGNKFGQKYKCFVAPDTGYRFFSKREVFCYLKTGKPRSHASEPNEISAGVHSATSEPNERSAGVHSNTSEPNEGSAGVHSTTSEPNERSSVVHSNTSEPNEISAVVHSTTSEPNERSAGMHSAKSASKVLEEKHTAEGLPPGWIKEIMVTQLAKGTRKDPYYIDSVTGYEFCSKKDVFRYLESGDLGKCASRPKKRQISDMDSIDGEIFGVQMKDLPPEWLPAGWSMEIKTRKSDSRLGQKYKCFIAPDTGYRFYSKREVFCYLMTGKPRRHASEPDEKSAGVPSTPSEPDEKSAGVPSTPSEPNERSAGVHSNTSEPNEIRSAVVHSTTSEPNERSAGMHSAKSASKVVKEKHTAEGLPPGWIKEIMVTQLAKGTRKDPYYIDSVTGYEFRSKKDVFRYLESVDLGKCASRPKKRQICDMDSVDGEIFEQQSLMISMEGDPSNMGSEKPDTVDFEV